MTHLIEAAVDIFIRGLPGELGRSVDLNRLRTIDDAYKEAVRLEARMDARVIPNDQTKGGYRGQDTYSRGSRSAQEERVAYVGYVQDGYEQDREQEWTELPEEWVQQEPAGYWEDYSEPEVPVESPVSGVYYTTPQPTYHWPGPSQPQSQNRAWTTNNWVPYSQAPGPSGYQLGPGTSRPGYRPTLLSRLLAFDPDRIPLQREPWPRPAAQGIGSQAIAPLPQPRAQAPPAPASTRYPPMNREDPNFLPTPRYTQPLNYQMARPNQVAGQQQQRAPNTIGNQNQPHVPAQTMSIQVGGLQQSTLRSVRTLLNSK